MAGPRELAGGGRFAENFLAEAIGSFGPYLCGRFAPGLPGRPVSPIRWRLARRITASVNRISGASKAMRAIEFVGPRKIVLRDDLPVPEPREGEVLVRCSHVALCADRHGPLPARRAVGGILTSRVPPGWLGHENLGTIVKSRVAGWEPGTLVLAHPDDYNGFVEYIRSKAGVRRLPPNPPDVAAMIVAQPLATVLRAMAQTGPVIDRRCAVLGRAQWA